MSGESGPAIAPRARVSRPAVANDFVAPRSPLERSLARLWEEVLAIEPVGVDDDFFDLGGESLHAFSLITRVAREFGTVLTPREVFEHPTVAAMAALVSARRPAD